MWSSAQPGPIAAVLDSAFFFGNNKFLITLYSNEDTSVEVSVVEKYDAYWMPYGTSILVENDQNQSVADFVLDSGYSPSGAQIEICKGKIENLSFSYYHPPSVDYSFSQEVPLNSTKYGMIKALLNSSEDRQNFFATIKSENGSAYIISHSYSDTRPRLSDPTIWVPEVYSNGSILLQVEPVDFPYALFYQVYIVNEAYHNSTPCGVM